MAENNRTLAALGYIPGLFWLSLFLSGDDELAKYHGRQALIVFVLGVLILIVFELVRFLFKWFYAVNIFLAFVEGALIVALIVASVIAAINAANGEFWRIPILGAYSDRLNI